MGGWGFPLGRAGKARTAGLRKLHINIHSSAPATAGTMTSKLTSHEFTVNRKQKFRLGAWPTCHPSSGNVCQLSLAPFSQVRPPCSPEHYCRMATGQRISLSTDLCSFQSLYNSFLYYIKTGNFTVSSVTKSIFYISPSSLEAFFSYKKLKMTLMRFQYIYISSSNQHALHTYLEISLKPYFKYQLHLYTLR